MSVAARKIRRHAARWHEPVEGGREIGIALGLGALYLALLLLTVGDLGYARDEGFYFDAARSYRQWFDLLLDDPARALADRDRYWKVNSEHPSLVKSLFALAHAWLWDWQRAFAMEGTSYRFAGMALSSLSPALAYLWGARARGRFAGLVAAGSLAAIPRFFYHAHLACFDAPVVTMWTLCAYTWWRSLQRPGWWRPLACGLTFALALDTKHNAWFLPIVTAAHAAFLMLPRVSEREELAALRRRALASLAAMATVGPLGFYALWPWLWRDPWARFGEYARFHLQHVYYNMEFLGRNYFEPPMPRGYAPLMTAATVPVVTLLCFLVGVALLARGVARDLRAGGLGASRRDPATGIFWALAIAVQYGAWLRETTPIFGGTKHWMTAYPFLALFAGVGLSQVVRLARVRWWGGALSPLARRPALEVAFGAAALVVPAVQAAHAHPWALSQYNVLVGGAGGGATLGLNRGFWGYQTGAITRHLDQAVPEDGRVYPHDTAAPSWDMLQRDGRLRSDVRAVWSPAAADVALYHHELHMLGVEYQHWIVFETLAPDHVAGLDGVPVIWTYRHR